MKTAAGLVWSLLALALFYDCGCHAAGEGDGAGERRSGSGRKQRNRGASLSSFRSESNSRIPHPIDPLFTDQREIRLSLKDRVWTGLGPSDAVDAHQSSSTPKRNHNNNKAKQQQPKSKKPSNSDSGSALPQPSLNKKPNIILMVTDDQDVELGSLDYMPKTRAILKEGGAFFPNSFVSTPMCCPSRSSMLTGLFVHNHGVLTNNDNCSSAYWQAEHEPRTFGAYLASAGYRTGYFGKYLNKYNGSYVPPGWREWAGLVMNSRYYNYTVNVNGQKVKHGSDYQTDYYPDLITNDSISFLRQSKQNYDHQPFLMVMSFPSPHGPEDSAPQYSNMFFNVTRHRTPSYDFAPNPDKQWILRWLGKMKPVHHRFTDMLMTKRLQTLQSVDEAVEKVFSELVALDQIDNTYIFYTSDHGYHLGQFGLIKGKSFPFESDIRVPFLVRGPGVGRGRVVQSLIGNVDLAPTFLDIAGLPVPPHMDGASIFRFFQKEKLKSRAPWRDTYLIERGKLPPSLFPKLNVNQDVPTNHNNEGAEGDDADGVSVEYSTPRGKFERWAVECRKPQYQSPCVGYQKYECVLADERWRMKKCSRSGNVQQQQHVIKKKWCKCKALSKYRLSKLEPEERRMQRAFLKEHTSVDWNGYRPKFLKTVAGSRSRSKRRAQPQQLQQPADPLVDGSVLRDVAEDELEQVELIMEDISDEISDLEALTVENNTSSSFNSSTEPPTIIYPAAASDGLSTVTPISPELSGSSSSKLNCQIVGKTRINCSSEVYSDPATWRLSRDYLEQQIRILRVQLDELKVIRKHLRAMRPFDSGPLSTPTSSRKLTEMETLPPSSQRRRKLNKATESPTIVGQKQSVDVDEGEEEEASSGPVETIQVTIYDNRKIKNRPSEPSGPLGMCPCVDVNWSRRRQSQARTEERQVRQAARRKLKEERQKRRQKKLSRKRAMAQTHDGQCHYDKMNCFSHDNDHWRTAPLWKDGPFCVCMNANNNTYWCVRTLNTTHNSLYCEFITGFVTYYDMRIDPYQLRNIAHTLSESQLAFFHQTLERLRVCRGADCFVNTHPSSAAKLAVSSQQAKANLDSSYHLQSSSHLVLDINSSSSSGSSSGRPKVQKSRRGDGYWRRPKRREERRQQQEHVVLPSTASTAA